MPTICVPHLPLRMSTHYLRYFFSSISRSTYPGETDHTNQVDDSKFQRQKLTPRRQTSRFPAKIQRKFQEERLRHVCQNFWKI